MPNKLELLAPAGSMEALKAALANGADAIYLGAAAFGARASAGFDENMLKEALSLAHLHRKKIYVTVNILVKERELSDVKKTLALLDQLGADAVLVQDLGILKICREDFPHLPVHASTQMALHNAQGARLLKDLGATRAVLARECTLDDMRAAAQTGMEIEAFCHGAMCVSVSGQCLFSSMIGGRSGNRGRCAQPCRLNYTYQGKHGAFLSPRDLCARDQLKKMAQAGVYSFKIEGRLKRPEYVAEVTRHYRAALDAILENRFSPADEKEKESLIQIFSRGGFTNGYPGALRDAGIIDPTRVTPIGLPMGRVEKVYQKGGALLCDVRLLRSLHNGDGLEIGDQEIRYSGPEVDAGNIATLRLRNKAKMGEWIRRTEDESQLAFARNTFEEEKVNQALSIPFDAMLYAQPGQEISLYVTDGESHVTLSGNICQEAANKPLDHETACRSLAKTGGTPFRLRDLQLQSEHAFVPAAALNALRRDALQHLQAARIAAHPRNAIPAARYIIPERRLPAPRLIAKTRNYAHIPALLSAGADQILYLPQDFREEKLLPLMQQFPKNTLLCLPGQLTEKTQARIKAWTKEYTIPLCLSSPGQLYQLQPGDIAGDGIPVMNSESLKMLAHLGLSSVTLSRELSKQEIADLPENICEMILPVYGRSRLMLLNHCPMRTALGLEKGREHCNLCEMGKGAMGTCLTDRMQSHYPLHPLRLPEGCLIEMLADKPLHLASHLQGLPALSYLMDFTDEDLILQKQIIAHYRAILMGDHPAPLPLESTLGRFTDGVI